MKAYDRQRDLEMMIKTYDANYRAGTPLATDEVYDQLLDELRRDNPDSELLKRGVISQSIGESRKERLPMPMYSLNKVKNVEEIGRWARSKGLNSFTEVVITPKYDGLSLVVDELVKTCWTRGDGEFGQNSTLHFERMNGYNSRPVSLFSYGEAIMKKKTFVEKYKGQFANARNLVAGALGRDIPNGTMRDIDYIRYGISTENCSKTYQLNLLNQKLNAGAKVQWVTTTIRDLDSKMLDDLYQQWSAEYQIDGLVIDVEDEDLRKKLGREINMNPAYAVAYKSPKWSQSADVRVLDVTWQVSKQGRLKPVINIEPTELSGVVISNVTGYNANYIVAHNIAEDSIIKIVRSGDVIPKHIETISCDFNKIEQQNDEMIICPSCGEPCKWDETFTELVCTNPECSEKQIAKLVHFFSTLEVEDFGEPSIRRFYNAGYQSAHRILQMSKREICAIDGFGSSSAERLLDQFYKLADMGVCMAKLVHAVDVMEGKIGEKTIQLIFDNLYHNEIFEIIDMDPALIERLTKIDGVAEITAKAFVRGMCEFNFYKMLRVNITYVQTPKTEIVGSKYFGWKICYTGCRPSKEKQQEIESQGGELVSGVSKNTTHLVVKDLSSTSSKMQKARELGVTILTASEI